MVQAAAAAGVPVPRRLAFEPAGGRLESAGFLMDHVEGTSVAPRVLRREELRAARSALPAQLGRGAGPDPLDRRPGHRRRRRLGSATRRSPPARCGRPTLDEIGEPLPAVEVGLRWLRLNPPPPPPRECLVHGDFRLGNFIVDEPAWRR